MARKNYSQKCPTCGINFFMNRIVVECYSCSYNRNVLHKDLPALPAR